MISKNFKKILIVSSLLSLLGFGALYGYMELEVERELRQLEFNRLSGHLCDGQPCVPDSHHKSKFAYEPETAWERIEALFPDWPESTSSRETKAWKHISSDRYENFKECVRILHMASLQGSIFCINERESVRLLLKDGSF